MKRFSIADIEMDSPTVMAPLAGVTNLPFRLMAKEMGAGLVVSEMVSANGLKYDSDKTCRLMESRPEEKPLSIQLFGSDPATMAEAARQVEATGAEMIDINCGCSVKKVLKTGSGSALMGDPTLAREIFRAVKGAISIPLTVKMRSGWDASGDDALLLARYAEEVGVDAVAVHPRTAKQAFRGHSDWSVIKRVKDALSIPVIGNGDILTPEDALRMFETTDCDAVMIGRAAIGDPALFKRINALLSGEIVKPSLVDHFAMMERYFTDSLDYFTDEFIACKTMRSRLGWFVKGLPGCSEFRQRAVTLSTREEGLFLIRSYKEKLCHGEMHDKVMASGLFE
ncbi:tRNA dihydrouridine synthase DusB [Desulfoluna spongiiphila]|uniref:tRNA-dihydrouridine synthase n=1 Tax=Desulfoluna spongiiphila TaxID=419481 RepID=A0A1G5I338_9BACT|nr:tRNA dihydrouridine synthase DusB [Desulfoluna spongiiphila]SCY70010.1 tRNA-U20-dihydrouridine synthase [Desulfoluna spongiiphila]VVS92647.1 trna-dihydrouridine synthase [Desulfoluna spongiiphila]